MCALDKNIIELSLIYIMHSDSDDSHDIWTYNAAADLSLET